LAAIMRTKLYKLHGEINQHERSRTFKAFCAASTGVLLCTDVAARGLDMPNVDWIIQYDPPTETTEYVHRIGRTARRGRAGSAILMLRPCEAGYVVFFCCSVGLVFWCSVVLLVCCSVVIVGGCNVQVPTAQKTLARATLSVAVDVLC
jgi:hypothetical protein